MDYKAMLETLENQEMCELETQLLHEIWDTATCQIGQEHDSDHEYGFSLFNVVLRRAHEPAMSWEVCRKSGEHENTAYFAVRRIWRLDLDLDHVKQRAAMLPVKRKYLPPLVPTIETTGFRLPDDWCRLILAKLQRIAVPIYHDGVFRDEEGREFAWCDGTSYDLAITSGYISATFHFPAEPVVTEWKPLYDFIQEVLDKLDRL